MKRSHSPSYLERLVGAPGLRKRVDKRVHGLDVRRYSRLKHFFVETLRHTNSPTGPSPYYYLFFMFRHQQRKQHDKQKTRAREGRVMASRRARDNENITTGRLLPRDHAQFDTGRKPVPLTCQCPRLGVFCVVGLIFVKTLRGEARLTEKRLENTRGFFFPT